MTGDAGDRSAAPISNARRLVLHVLQSVADEAGVVADWSRARLGMAARLAQRTVSYHTAGLVAAGYLVIDEVDGKPSVYRLTVLPETLSPPLQDPAPLTPPVPSETVPKARAWLGRFLPRSLPGQRRHIAAHAMDYRQARLPVWVLSPVAAMVEDLVWMADLAPP